MDFGLVEENHGALFPARHFVTPALEFGLQAVNTLAEGIHTRITGLVRMFKTAAENIGNPSVGRARQVQLQSCNSCVRRLRVAGRTSFALLELLAYLQTFGNGVPI